MQWWVDTSDPLAVAARVRAGYAAMFSDAQPLFVPQVFGWAIDAFSGRHPDYLPIDTRYHDLEHTLQGTLCYASMLHGRAMAGAEPVLPRGIYELGLIAILLHDTGYLKDRQDTLGTGAKYTRTHVHRSCQFAERLLTVKGLGPTEITAVQNMIRCTGMGTNVTAIPFGSEEERIAGYALGTADLLGQMAAGDYVDKLPILYEEFAESAAFNGGEGAPFRNADDLMQRTPAFWQHYVLPKVEGDFKGLYRYLASIENGRNVYLDRIENNLTRLRRRYPIAA
jgi:hypothetical protein